MYHPELLDLLNNVTVQEIDVAIGTSVGTLMNADTDRIGFVLYSGGANKYLVRPIRSAGPNVGYPVPADSGAHFFTVDDWGPLIREQWTAISITAAQTVRGEQYLSVAGLE